MWLAYVLIPISLFLLFLIVGDFFAPKEKLFIEGEVVRIGFPVGSFVILAVLMLFIALSVLCVIWLISGTWESIVFLVITVLVGTAAGGSSSC